MTRYCLHFVKYLDIFVKAPKLDKNAPLVNKADMSLMLLDIFLSLLLSSILDNMRPAGA